MIAVSVSSVAGLRRVGVKVTDLSRSRCRVAVTVQSLSQTIQL